MEAKHTPGPWKLRGSTGYGDMDGHRVGNSKGYIIAVAIGDIPDLPSEANARLISAAPDLLEVLEELLFEDSDKSDADRIVTRLKARAAIAKASLPQTEGE